MTNRELLNRCNDKAFVKFLLRQRGCLLCVARNACPHNPGGPSYDRNDTNSTCEKRLLAWLKQEAQT